MKKRAAIYTRVSTEKQEAENQLRDLQLYARRAGYQVMGVYQDTISGKENSRPAFDRLFKHAHQRLFDVVLFWDLSRFSRSGTLFTLQRLQTLTNLEIAWESYQEPYFRSLGEFCDVVLAVMATLAKIEREKISDRTKAGLRLAKARGKHIGRPMGTRTNIQLILDAYQREGSINGAAKVLPYSYGTVHAVIKKSGIRNTDRKPLKAQ